MMIVLVNIMKVRNTFEIVIEEYDTDENGKIHGMYIKRNTNNHLKIKCNYDHGILHGKYIEYGGNDIYDYKLICNYKHGKLDGVYKTYDHGCTKQFYKDDVWVKNLEVDDAWESGSECEFYPEFE